MQYTNNTLKHIKQIPTHKEPLKTSQQLNNNTLAMFLPKFANLT